MSERDFQKSKVYKWENTHVAPKGGKHLRFDELQAVTNAIWQAMGLLYPPKIVEMPKQNRRAWAKANREQIWAPPMGLPTWVLIHEIAHSMTSTVDQETERHGPVYVGVYMQLLDKFLKIPQPLLWHTAKISGVKFDPFAKPSFLDQ